MTPSTPLPEQGGFNEKSHRWIRSYKVVDIDKVEEYSAEGYEPVGGVAISISPDGNVLVQAMALYEDVFVKVESEDTHGTK